MIVEIIIVYIDKGNTFVKSFFTEESLLKYIEQNNDIRIVKKTIIDL